MTEQFSLLDHFCLDKWFTYDLYTFSMSLSFILEVICFKGASLFASKLISVIFCQL